ncbi:MAG: hypothetical protein KZQ95_02705 [Candidatus Thiodiazotropha sp. (ex Epidulcina cf. delphinae)]|nr:hypothetical protein [Candidatus Thiodiazotropha sp. (ex Epidulcina cf. delphinae)]
MNKSEKKVVRLHRQIEEFNQTTSGTVSEVFPGFSKRLNHLIDLTDLNVPAMDDGRQAYISALLQASKMAPGDWLKKNKPPKTTTLRKLVIYLLSRIPGDHNPFKIEAWLKYGDEAVQNPFNSMPQNSQALIPLATALIVSVAKEINVTANEFDLNKVLSATVETLSDFQLTHESMVEAVHRKIIAQYIKSNPR